MARASGARKVLVWLPNSKLNSARKVHRGGSAAACAMRFTANGRRDLSPIQVRFVGVQQYAHTELPHVRVYALPILSFCHASKFLCAHTPRSIRQKYIYMKRSFVSVFPSILIITIGATKTRKEFRESREIVHVYLWEICTYGVYVFRETHPRKCLQIFKWQTCV